MNAVRRFVMPWMIAPLFIALVATIAQPLSAQDAEDAVLLADGPSGELKPMAVIALAPYEKLVSDIGFLGNLAGKPELGQMLEGGFSFFTQGKGPDAIDKTKPLGIVVQTDSDGRVLPVFCLPVKNIDDVMGIATAYGAKLSEGDGGVKTLELPNQTIYVKHNEGWAFVGQSPTALEILPADPQATLTKLLDEYDVVVDVAVKDVPDTYRQFALSAMKAGMDQQLVKQEQETDAEFEARREMAEAQMKQMEQMINEIDQVTLGWSIDAEQERTFLDFVYQVKPGSKLERQTAAYKDTRTNFAGFYQPDAAATATFAMQADPKMIAEDIDQFNAGMQQMRSQFNKAVDQNDQIEDDEARETIKTAGADWFDALEATMKAGRLDGGATLQLGPESLTLIVGAHVKDPEKIVTGLKKMEEAAKKKADSKFPGIKWDAATHAGVKFHTITVPIPEEQDSPRKLLGEEADIAIGIGPEAVYLAVGRDNLETVNKAIDASAAEKEKSVPPFELAISLGPVLEVAASQTPDPQQRTILEKVADMLKNEAAGRDHIRIVGHVVPNGLRYRIEAEEGVLRGMGKATAEAQKQALEAQRAQ